MKVLCQVAANPNDFGGRNSYCQKKFGLEEVLPDFIGANFSRILTPQKIECYASVHFKHSC